MNQQQQQTENNNNIIIIPTDVIVHHIAPFVNDRTTFDNLCCYTNRSILNGIQNSCTINPPWPDRVTLQSNSDIGRTFPTSISMAINNTMLVCGGLNGQVHLWDSHLKKDKKKKQPPSSSPPPTLSSSSSPPSLVSKSTTTTTTTTNSSSSSPSSSSTMILKTNKKEGRITAVAISPDGNKLVCGGIRYVYLWNKQRKNTTSIMEDYDYGGNNNNNTHNSSSSSTSFQFQDPPQRLGRWMPIIERFNRQAMREHRYRTSLLLDFSSDSKYIISSRRFHIADRHEELYTIKIWNSNNDDGLCLATLLGLDTTTQQQQQNTNNTDAVVDGGSSHYMIFSAIFSPVHPNQFVCVQAGPGIFRDKHAILICDVDKEIEIYNNNNNNVTPASAATATTTTTSSTYIRTRIKTNSQISSISFSPNGKYLVSCSFNGSIHVWDITSQQCIKVIEGTTTSSKHINKARSISPRLLVRVAVTFISPVDFVTAQNDTIQQWTIATENTKIKNNQTSQHENKENNGNDLHNNDNDGGETNATTTTTAASPPPTTTTTTRTTTTIPKQNHQKKKKNHYSTNTARFSSWKSLFQMKGRKQQQQQQQQQHPNNKNYYYYYSGYNNDFASSSSSFFCRHNNNVTMTVASRNQQILASRDKSGEIRIVQIQSLH